MMSARTHTPESLAELEAALLILKGPVSMKPWLANQAMTMEVSTSRAAVDSELALVLGTKSYSYDGYLPNPLNWRMRKNLPQIEQSQGGRVLMVSRLDAPKPEQVMRMVLDGLEAEKKGLKGLMYIDSGAVRDGAEECNKHLSNLADIVGNHTRLKGVMDTSPDVFQPGQCPNAALYVGWYSLQKYVPAFTWVPGAVAYHMASWEAMHLRDPNTEEWVPKMIAGRVSATIGAADEPFLQGFPPPDEFFSMVFSGKMTVAEAYWQTVPNVSWRMMLFADPLYNPFAAFPQPVTLPDTVGPASAPTSAPGSSPASSS